MTDTVTIYPRGVRTEVPVDVCRCPILHVGDGCPVHQQLPQDMAHLDRASLILPLLLTAQEITVLAIALAVSLEPDCQARDATEASAVVWTSPKATRIQQSLATALAEATY